MDSAAGHSATGHSPTGHSPTGHGPAGLFRGASGAALLFVRLYEQTRDSGFLDMAEYALAADLDRCVTDRRGALQVDDGWRLLPYLDGGSTGIGLVLDEFLAHRDNERFTQAAGAIQAAACSGFYAQSGLLNGRAGMLFYLARRRAPAAHPDAGRHADRHVRRLAWHAVRYADGLAFPGDQLFRLSMDLGTGSAGVLIALAAALAPEGASLPFLPAPGRATARAIAPEAPDGHTPQAPSQPLHARWAGNKIPSRLRR
jgi:hypothetical protein